jgi:hypothetical protein
MISEEYPYDTQYSHRLLCPNGCNQREIPAGSEANNEIAAEEIVEFLNMIDKQPVLLGRGKTNVL